MNINGVTIEIHYYNGIYAIAEHIVSIRICVYPYGYVYMYVYTCYCAAYTCVCACVCVPFILTLPFLLFNINYLLCI